MALSDILLEQAIDAFMNKIQKIPLVIKLDEKWTITITAKERYETVPKSV